MKASEQMNKYFDIIDKGVKEEFKIAEKARKKGYDPDTVVEVKLAKNLAERVVGLVSVMAPQIVDSKIVPRILELEKKWSPLDWRVALQIALEVAQQKYCAFTDEKEAIEVGIRVGFAYVTLGVVSSPLEGFTTIEFKNRLDGKGKYFCMNFAGPIRNAGGTMAALSVIIADYVRKHTGYAEYDPTEKEILRCHAELEDYHEYITNLQYFPSTLESEFMLKHLPIEISGDASEKYEVSNAQLKDLPRVPVNKLRSGYCLIHSSCLPLKAPKLWKQLNNWKEEMGLEHWQFLEEFIAIQKEARAKGKKSESGTVLTPDYNYIKDLVAGRPVFGHPLRSGAFRLRYGRSRTSGYSAMSIHPATMHVMKDFLASATHMKVERPSKGAALTSCDTIDGPIVKLKDGSVRYLSDAQEAKRIQQEVVEVIYIGDLLVSYGDFLDRAHPLVPAGYCQEFWSGEVEKAAVEHFGTLDYEKIAEVCNISAERIKTLLKKPLSTKISFSAAQKISQELSVPLHSHYTYFWSQITVDQMRTLLEWVLVGEKKEEQFFLPLAKYENAKRALEIVGLPHIVVGEYAVLSGQEMLAFLTSLGDPAESLKKLHDFTGTSLEAINLLAPFRLRDKAGVFIGGRMGRPEKAKMRKMTGSPHMLFTVGAEGGRLRSIQSALEKKKIKGDFSIFWCEKCVAESIYRRCHRCDGLTQRKGMKDGQVVDYDAKDKEQKPSSIRELPISEYIEAMLKKMNTRIMPDLIKGVRGTGNKEHMQEHIMKGILRAKHDIAVNKDGTTRYDASEVTLTHFKPIEIGASVERLRELGYEKDIHGKDLENEQQVLELKVQDIVCPACPASPDEGADDIMMRTANFIDEMLVSLYGMRPYYTIRSREDLIGQYVIGLAPHTSAGMIGRVIGFSQTQGFLAHPYYHAACRRDCDGDELGFMLVLDAFLNFSRKYLPESRGSTMDAPLVLTTSLDPSEVDDMAFNVDIPWRYPLELYLASQDFKMPWEVKIPIINHRLNHESQYEGFGFTHDTGNFNDGVLCSAYKTLPSMKEKLTEQMALAEVLRAVDEHDVARLVIEKHFIRDTKGNLRKFSLQQFRCVACNAKFRRPPLQGRCTECGGKVIFTISEGSVVKYLEPSLSLAEKYEVGPYLRQTLELTKVRIESYFGKDKEKQLGLGAWFEEEEVEA